MSKPNEQQFPTLAEAESWLESQGFRLVPDSCTWTKDAGDDAGCYAIEGGRYGTVKGFRVEIQPAARNASR